MREEVREVVNALGAITEVAGFMMKEFQKQGFSRKEALELTREVVRSLLPSRNGEENAED